jgi:hypothetical protein
VGSIAQLQAHNVPYGRGCDLGAWLVMVEVVVVVSNLIFKESAWLTQEINKFYNNKKISERQI